MTSNLFLSPLPPSPLLFPSLPITHFVRILSTNFFASLHSPGWCYNEKEKRFSGIKLNSWILNFLPLWKLSSSLANHELYYQIFLHLFSIWLRPKWISQLENEGQSSKELLAAALPRPRCFECQISFWVGEGCRPNRGWVIDGVAGFSFVKRVDGFRRKKAKPEILIESLPA